MERSRDELILFAVGVLGVWLGIWAVILLSAVLGVAAFVLALGALCVFALREDREQGGMG